MTLIDNTHYLSREEYDRPIEALRQFTVLVLFSFALHSDDLKERIVRNFIARGMTCVESLFSIWGHGNIQDCWILHRSLIDRLFHLRSLYDKDEFAGFEKWSFLRRFEARNSVLSDPELRKKLKPEQRSFTSPERNRYDQLRQEKIQWKRPNAKQVAQDMNLSFLYKIGYDPASTQVHPLSNDGEEDFFRLTGLGSETQFDNRVVLHNSLIVQMLLVQEGLNVSSLHWRRIVYDFLENFGSLLGTGDQKYRVTLAELFDAGPDFHLCQTPDYD